MKKIKSYTSIWSVEKVIYAINDFQLPFPVTFSQMAWFVLSLFIVILFAELPPFSMIDGAFLKYFGIPVVFTWFVFEILKLLLQNPKKVYTKEQIYSLVWNDAYLGDENAVNVHISRLRTKIEDNPRDPQYIITVWGIGYKLGDFKE